MKTHFDLNGGGISVSGYPSARAKALLNRTVRVNFCLPSELGFALA